MRKRSAFDKAYEIRNSAMVAVLLISIAIGVVIFPFLSDPLGPEGAAGSLLALQLAALGFAPDWLVMLYAKWLRRTQSSKYE